jgi:hypothetical protein
MTATEFDVRRRQPFLDESVYNHTLAWFNDDELHAKEQLNGQSDAKARGRTLEILASQLWDTFRLRYTAGEDLDELAQSLTEIVAGYELMVEALDDVPDEKYYPPFILNETVDVYANYLNLIAAAVLLHREDLIPRICALNEGTDFDGSDAVIEDLLGFYLPDRPFLDGWFWKPYTPLLHAIDQETPEKRAEGMEKYVKGWYKSMKGIAHFWGKHEQNEPDFTPYFGYWAMCAAAFTYLYDIDDSTFRDEMVYPKDMIDYARSMPRNPVKLDDGSSILRVLGGQACPADGQWFSPAKPESTRHFKKGDMMPVFDSEYGQSIWQIVKPDAA